MGLTICTLGYLKEEIMKYERDSSQFGMNIPYSIENEEKMLCTSGAIKNSQGLLSS
jgi:NDP-sugar pyrophosphorylase family protein